MRMTKIKAMVYEPYLDEVLRSIGELGVVQFIDLRAKLDKWEGALKPVEPTKTYHEYSNLHSRITRLIQMLGISEEAPKEKVAVAEKPLEDLIADFDKNLNAIESQYKNLMDKLKALDERTEIPEEKREEEKKLLSDQLKAFVEGKKQDLRVMFEVIDNTKKLGETKQALSKSLMTFYLEAWAPREKIDQVVQGIKDSSENCCFIQLEETHSNPKEEGEEGKEEHAPTLLSNPSFLKPFQQLVTAYGLPSYDEFDPSFFMAITFPILFGLMFGDVGHGLILAIFGLAVVLLRNKAVQPGDIIRYVLSGGELFLLCGILSILSGLMFGELFGYHISHFGIKEPPLGFILKLIPGIGEEFSPLENPIKMFKLSLMVGTVCITFGIVLNLATKLMNKEFKEAFFESVCWLWFYLGLMYLILFGFGVNIDLWFSNLTTVSLAVIIPLILMLAGEAMIKGAMEGFSHFFEIAISSLGNTVSYGRILALALAHGIIGQLLATAIEAGVAGIAIAVIGTIFLVMMLEGLIIFIHTVRLHWVEWFSKFYKGEGTEYTPLKLRQKYTYQKIS